MMTVYARIANSVVVEFPPVLAGFTIDQCYPASFVAQCVDVTNITPAPIVGDIATEAAGVWSFAAPVAPVQTLAQQAAAALNAGLTITLNGTLTLAATAFPTDPTTTGKIGAVITTINTTSAFPGGTTSYPMKDFTGAWHTFTLGQYKAVAAAIAGYAAALDLIADGNPMNAATLPQNSVTLTV